ncbi:FkbM family methyltransferase [Rhodoluna lacicola]|uniref:FkbM family methyltransferase n=1 Tax=Rhodoluna lacicola TaxID=529884 RepID=UPI0022321A18|nr:FkbM family methyltransferase [Rhodoluna lacicola]
MTLHFLEHGVWEPHVRRVIRESIHEGDWVMDIGANIGLHTIFMAKLVGDTGHVQAIEAYPETCAWLYKNIDINGLNSRVEVIERAIGFSNGEVEFSYFLEHPGMSGVRISESVASNHKATLVKSKVKMTNLDTLLESRGGEVPKFIKIDVEGLELEVLKGAAELLAAKQPPIILLEFNSNMAIEVSGQTAGLELESLMRNNSYEIFRVELDKNVRLEPGELESQSNGDFLFVNERTEDKS